MKRALITGTGMDAKVMTHFLISKDYQVYVCTRRNTVFEFKEFEKIFEEDLKKNTKASLKTLYIDVSDQDSVSQGLRSILKDGPLNEIYHLAASSHVGFSYSTPSLNIQTNGMSSFFFLDFIKENTPKTRYYFASTTEMFSGNVGDQKYTEESRLYPKTPYGISKCLGFYWTQYFRETYGLFAASGILANHSCEYRHNSFFIKKITEGAAKIVVGLQNEVSIGHLDWARDEFWADFGMEAAWQILQLENPEDMIIGNGNAKWGEEYVSAAFEYFNLDWREYVKFDKSLLRKNEVVKLEVDPSKAINKIGWKVDRMSFKDHIGLMCQWDFNKAVDKVNERVNVFEKYPK